MARRSFREQVLRAREDAIVDTVNRLLADKGYELMTVDEVAAEVGIAKASLYKHFPSKEALAAAAMAKLLEQALAYVESLAARAELSAYARLELTVRWLLEVQLSGQMPTLPAQNSSLRAALLSHAGYMNALLAASERLGQWIVQAQADGEIEPALPVDVVLYTVFARACDPVPAFLKAGGGLDDGEIVRWVLHTCMRGLRAG